MIKIKKEKEREKIDILGVAWWRELIMHRSNEKSNNNNSNRAGTLVKWL